MEEYNLLSKEGIKWIVDSLINRAKENLLETSEQTDDYSRGYRFACYEFLDMIKSRIEIREGDLKDYGLDIDLESLLLAGEE